jgi:uncharacterized membrane protein
MPHEASTQRTRFPDALRLPGRILFSLTFIALGMETIICARVQAHPFGPAYASIPCLPWLPAIPWLALAFGVVWAACGAGMLVPSRSRIAAWVLGVLLLLCTLAIVVPKYAANLNSMGLRTIVFEPVALACIALLLPGRNGFPAWLDYFSRFLLAVALIVFGVDHFLAIQGIAALVPRWIPWPVFWVEFCGAAFIAAGLSIALGLLQRWGAAGLGLMFAIWVVTLHLPRVLGLYGIPGAQSNPDEWSSLFIAVGLWGGLWTLARGAAPKKQPDNLSILAGQTTAAPPLRPSSRSSHAPPR